MVETIGPGHYSPERADPLTKPDYTIKISELSRKNPHIDSDNGPGTYEELRTLDKGIKGGYIGSRQEEKIP